MRILTIRGSRLSGKTTFLIMGAAATIKREYLRDRKPRVLLVSPSSHKVKILLRNMSEMLETLGLSPSSDGEHGCVEVHTATIATLPNLRASDMDYDYVVADDCPRMELSEWARKYKHCIEYLIVSEESIAIPQHVAPDLEALVSASQ